TAAASGTSLHLAGRAVGPGFDVAANYGPGFAAEAAMTAIRIAMPPVGAYLGCLGDFLGADIRFCRDYGLNVHGKALYFLIPDPTDTRIVADRNVHDRLVLFTGSTYASWSARQGPGTGELSVSVNGTPVALGPDGSFDVTIDAPAGRATVLVTTT